MAITAEEIERERKTLPFGWGRFGKALERLAELSAPGESLIASCIALNPEYQYKPRGVPGHIVSTVTALHELTKTTNILLACTDERLIAMGTGAGGAPRDHVSIPYDGLEVISRDKKEFVLGMPDGQMRIRGAAKQQVPRFLESLEARSRVASSSA